MTKKIRPICKNCEFCIPYITMDAGLCKFGYRLVPHDFSCDKFQLLKWYELEGYEVGEEEEEKE